MSRHQYFQASQLDGLQPHGLSCSLVFLIWVALSTSARAQQPDTEVQLYDYVVQEGESCAGIAARELGNRKAYSTIHKYNALGPLPHNLKAGQVLRLPIASRQSAAKLESRIGKVEYRKAAESLWGMADQGLDLFRAWRVWSHQQSTAVLVFRDDSVLSMREHTVVVIYGPSAFAGRRKVVRAELVEGSLRSRLAALEGQLLVETDSASMQLGEGTTVVSASKARKRSTLSNHGGKAVAVRQRTPKGSRGSKSTSVIAGKGTWVDQGKPPAPPRDLPPVPTLVASPALQVSMAADGTVLTGSWNPVAEAERYRVEIAVDPNIRLVVAAFEVTKTVTSFEARGLKAGRYYVSVASIDAEGLESIPSNRNIVDTVALERVYPDTRGEPDEQGEPSSPALVQGSQLVAPGDVLCSLDQGVGQKRLALLERGRFQVHCVSAAGLASNALDVEVVGTQIEFADSASKSLAIVVDRDTEVLLVSNPMLPSNAKLQAIVGTRVVADVVSVGAEGIRLLLRASDGAPTEETLKLYRETEAGRFLLASFDLSIVSSAPGAPTSPKAKTQASRVSVGALVGISESRLEVVDSDRYSGIEPLIGLRAGVAFSSQFSIEAETLLLRMRGDQKHLAQANQLLLGWHPSLFPEWLAGIRLGAALWRNVDPKPSPSLRIGGALGLSAQHNAFRFDLSTFALADVSYRLVATVSYPWHLDFLSK